MKSKGKHCKALVVFYCSDRTGSPARDRHHGRTVIANANLYYIRYILGMFSASKRHAHNDTNQSEQLETTHKRSHNRPGEAQSCLVLNSKLLPNQLPRLGFLR